MIKTYRFNRKQNYARIVVKTAQGGQVVYEFINGNPMANILPKCIVKGEWEQEQLENSVYIKSKLVALESVAESEAEKKARIAKENAPVEEADETAEEVLEAEDGEKLQVVPEVKSVTQATAYIYENFGVTVKSAVQAKNVAKKHGVVFPNLKIGKTSK